MSQFLNLNFTGDQASQKVNVLKLPELPDDVLARFPSLKQWQEDMEKWRQQLVVALRGKAN